MPLPAIVYLLSLVPKVHFFFFFPYHFAGHESMAVTSGEESSQTLVEWGILEIIPLQRQCRHTLPSQMLPQSHVYRYIVKINSFEVNG